MFLKKHFTIIGLACVLSVPVVDAGAEGFAINEWSAEGVAMGGARMFAENDAANIAYNPASITKVRGEAFKQSAVYISPHGKYKAYDDQVDTCSKCPCLYQGFSQIYTDPIKRRPQKQKSQ